MTGRGRARRRGPVGNMTQQAPNQGVWGKGKPTWTVQTKDVKEGEGHYVMVARVEKVAQQPRSVPYTAPVNTH